MRASDDESSIFYNWVQLGTGFSGFRWAVPELCNFTGRALYLDVDILNFKDIAELYYTDMNDYALLCLNNPPGWPGGRNTSVALFNCELMQPLLPPVELTKTIFNIHPYVFSTDSPTHIPLDRVGELDPRWNVLDGKGPGGTDLDIKDMWMLHYTDPTTQPWASLTMHKIWKPHPRTDLYQLWHDTYKEAVDSHEKLQSRIL